MGSVLIEVWRSGAWGEVHVLMGPLSEPLAVIAGLKRSAPSAYRQVLARFQRLADYGPSWHDWYKRLEDAEDLHQLRYEQHRFLLFPHPHKARALVLLTYFRKQQQRTPPAELRKALTVRRRVALMLSKESNP